MAEKPIDPKFNIHETYRELSIVNPYREPEMVLRPATLQLMPDDAGGAVINGNNLTILENASKASARVVEQINRPGDFIIEARIIKQYPELGAAKINYNDDVRNHINFMNGSAIPNFFDLPHEDHFIYRINYRHKDEWFKLQYSTDLGATWTSVKDYSWPIESWPLIVYVGGKNYNTWGECTWTDIKISTNFE